MDLKEINLYIENMKESGVTKKTLKAIKVIRDEIRKRVLPEKESKKKKHSKKSKKESPPPSPVAKKTPRILPSSIITPPPKTIILAKKAPRPLPNLTVSNSQTPQFLTKPPQTLPPQYLSIPLPTTTTTTVNPKSTTTTTKSTQIDYNKELERMKKEKEILVKKINSLNANKEVQRSVIRLNDSINILYNTKTKTITRSIFQTIGEPKLKSLLNSYYCKNNLNENDRYIVDDYIRYKGFVILLNKLIDNFKDIHEFLEVYCKICSLSRSLTNVYITTFKIPKLYQFVTQSINKFNGDTSLIPCALYTQDKRKKINKLLLDIFERIKLTKCINDTIVNKYQLFTSDFIIKFLLTLTFLTTYWPAPVTFQEVECARKYQYLMLKRTSTKNNETMYLPLIREDGTLEKTKKNDVLLSTAWKRKMSISSMPKKIVLAEKIQVSSEYFARIVESMHETLFPPMNNVKK